MKKIIKYLLGTVITGSLLIFMLSCGKDSSVTGTPEEPLQSSPAISSVSPDEGAVGTELTIDGSEFEAGIEVVIGGVTANSVEVSSSTTLFVLVPSGIAGNTPLDIQVTNSDGGQASVDDAFTAIDPVLDYVNSATKPSGNVGSTVIIEGRAFGDTQGDGLVLFSDGTGGTITATIASDDDWTDTFIVTTVPSGAGDGPIYVETEIGASDSLQFKVTDAATFSPSTINWTVTTSLPAGVSGHQAVFTPIDDASGNTQRFVHVTGGRDAAGLDSDQALVGQINSDGTVSAWNSTAALPDSISFHASVVATPFNSKVSGKGYLYTIGGVNNSGTIVSDVYAGSLNEDGTVSSWSSGRALPEPLHSMGAVIFRGNIYVAGGATTNDTPTAKVYKATIDTVGNLGTWEEMTSLPSARMYHGFVQFGKFLYSVGGETASETPDDGDFNNNDTKLPTVAYAEIDLRSGDISSSSWTVSPNEMGKNRSKHSTLVAGGNLFVSSGLYSAAGTGSSENIYTQIFSDGTIDTFNGATGDNTLSSQGGENLFNQAAISYIDANGVAHVMILGGDDVNSPGNKQADVLFY